MLIALGLMFVCLGIHVLLFWRRQLLKEKHALNWPVINGKVIESHVIAGDSDNMDALKFTYSYEFAGKKYTSSTIDFFESPSRLTNSELKEFSQKIYSRFNGQRLLQSTRRCKHTGAKLS